MKHTSKTLLTLFLAGALLLATLSLAACGQTKEDGKLTIGVIQYMSHPSLDNCYEGIVAALEASDLSYEVVRQIGSAASADADCASYARTMVASQYDLIVAIATPAAKSAYNATADTDIPVIFCAVSDPVAAGLVASLEAPGEACTGTSDILDLEAQVDLITALQPDVQTIGVLYTSSEENSLTNLARFKEVCAARSLTVEARAVQNGADVPSAAEELASKVDCINNFTDNNVVQNLAVVLSAAEEHGIAVYGSEEEQVKAGCLASVSIDYVALGEETGRMAVEVLKGADAATMAVRTISQATPVVNRDTLAALGLTLPDSFADAAMLP